MGNKRPKKKLKVKKTKLTRQTGDVAGAGFWQDFEKSFVQSFEKTLKVTIESAKELSTSSLV
jgi:hypothetical protein